MRLTLTSGFLPNAAGLTLEACQLAADYSAHFKGVSLVVQVEGQTIFEDYPHGHPDRAHDIASGTKSFAGALALAAVADGRLRLDEPVCATLSEWREQPRKSLITVRQLLQLTSGLESGGKPGKVPTAAEALHARCVFPPGERFLYGSASFQIFGEVLRRKLADEFPDPLDYLQARVFDSIGLTVGRWRRGADGQPQWSSGAALTARAWASFGELVRADGHWHGREVLPANLLRESFHGSADNPAYGLAWWLNAKRDDSPRLHHRRVTFGLDDLAAEPAIPADLVFAAGAGKQRLYVSRQRRLVVARQAAGILEALASGERGGFSDREFLVRLLTGHSADAASSRVASQSHMPMIW